MGANSIASVLLGETNPSGRTTDTYAYDLRTAASYANAGSMVNARIDRCVYGAANPKGGALGTVFDVSHTPELNHA